MNEIKNQGKALKDFIEDTVLKEAQQTNTKIPHELTQTIHNIPNMGDVLNVVMPDHKANKVPKLDVIQYVRQTLSIHINTLNALYFKYFKGDKRLNEPVMKMISLLNTGISLMDSDYTQAYNAFVEDDDLDTVSKELYHNKKIQIGDKTVILYKFR